jgi:hypothetical protein
MSRNISVRKDSLTYYFTTWGIVVIIKVKLILNYFPSDTTFHNKELLFLEFIDLEICDVFQGTSLIILTHVILFCPH